MASLNLGLPFHSVAGRSLRRRSLKPAARQTVSCSSSLTNKFKRAYTSVMIVPTGVGAAIGGYAGDALPVARALSSIVDCLISHPNNFNSFCFENFICSFAVLNAAMLYWPMPNVLYVEGYALDRFAEGHWALQPVHQNKVGLVLDAGIEEDLRLRHLQVVDATRASLGLPVVEYTVTDAALQVCKVIVDKLYDVNAVMLDSVEKWIELESGQSTGRIKRLDSLLRAVEKLVDTASVNAIAVVARFPDDDTEDDVENYRQGKGIDLLAGVEAVISHLVVERFGIPCAHAPALLPFPLNSSLSPKSAAEEIGYTFLPCVLAGLSTAPQYLVENPKLLGKDSIVASDVDSVILPIDACGGDGALAFASRKTNRPLIIAVEENETVLSDTPDKLGIQAVKVANYWEAIGVVAAHKAGIDPFSLRRDGINNIRLTMNHNYHNNASSLNGCGAVAGNFLS
ncbi:pentafunctional AROM polypeptide [Striga asiatica]|uniref:Pentafunctional AROM polypeptide n=1 Tax=Striga asiatica TaxID=4170 RepID=A0A5A7Q0J6_STRAF|nr:pentafunctional AROM polypeptide [Striga asiatica]